mmetsp:Transcript_4666/g.14480  ORF Transcript_4666/g.14480 Transcript_4666/m.14480 type:complete len:216 (-) Transcript_4666:576-1223(-)
MPLDNPIHVLEVPCLRDLEPLLSPGVAVDRVHHAAVQATLAELHLLAPDLGEVHATQGTLDEDQGIRIAVPHGLGALRGRSLPVHREDVVCNVLKDAAPPDQVMRVVHLSGPPLVFAGLIPDVNADHLLVVPVAFRDLLEAQEPLRLCPVLVEPQRVPVVQLATPAAHSHVVVDDHQEASLCERLDLVVQDFHGRLALEVGIGPKHILARCGVLK